MTTEEEPILRVEGLKKHFVTKDSFFDRMMGQDETVYAVDGVDFEIQEGEVVGLVGESGCGKSTLGRTLLRLEEPTEGRIYYKGKDITSMQNKEMKSLRRKFQIIFQDAQSSLNSRKTVSQIITSPMEIQGLYEGERQERVVQLLNDVGLNERFLNTYPHQLSGGQQQRVNIARALSVDPEFIVCDEVTSALDVSIQAQILSLLENLQEKHNLTLIFIAHDLSVIRYISDRVYVMYLGRIAEKSPVKELFRNPKHPYTKALLSSVADPDPHAESRKAILKDNVPSPKNPPSGCRFHPRCPEYIGEICEAQEPEYYDVDENRQVHCHLFREEQLSQETPQEQPSDD